MATGVVIHTPGISEWPWRECLWLYKKSGYVLHMTGHSEGPAMHSQTDQSEPGIYLIRLPARLVSGRAGSQLSIACVKSGLFASYAKFRRTDYKGGEKCTFVYDSSGRGGGREAGPSTEARSLHHFLLARLLASTSRARGLHCLLPLKAARVDPKNTIPRSHVQVDAERKTPPLAALVFLPRLTPLPRGDRWTHHGSHLVRHFDVIMD